MENCIFCQIIRGTIPSQIIYEDEDVCAFEDITPQTPIHVLVVPKIHVADLTEAAHINGLYEACLKACVRVAVLTGVDRTGYRIAANTGSDACQSVAHLHFHVLGGAKLSGRMA